MPKFILPLLLLFPPFGLLRAATPAELNAVADAYIEAYTSQDLDTLATFYTTETLFDDPTAAGMWGEAFRVKAGDNIIQAMRTGWTAVKGFHFEVRERITYHDRVVLIGTSNLTLDGSMIGKTPGTIYNSRLPAVTILQIHEGKVLLHLDHYDYQPLRTVTPRKLTTN